HGEPVGPPVSGAEGGQLTPAGEAVPARLRRRLVVPGREERGPLGERQCAVPAGEIDGALRHRETRGGTFAGSFHPGPDAEECHVTGSSASNGRRCIRCSRWRW